MKNLKNKLTYSDVMLPVFHEGKHISYDFTEKEFFKNLRIYIDFSGKTTEDCFYKLLFLDLSQFVSFQNIFYRR